MADDYELPPPTSGQPDPWTQQPAPPTPPQPYAYGDPSAAPTPYVYGDPNAAPTPYAYGDPNTPTWGFAPVPPPIPAQAPSSRRAIIIAVAAVVVVILVVAAINVARRNRNTATGPLPHQSFSFSFSIPTPSRDATPNPGRTSGGFGTDPDGTAIPAVFCPIIRDEKSFLSYRCIDDGMEQGKVDNYLGLRISLDRLVEPGWVVSQGSGNPEALRTSPTDSNQIAFVAPAAPTATSSPAAPASPPSAAEVESTVQARAELALAKAYGDNPTSTVLNKGARNVGGAQGFELTLEITMNPDWAANRPDYPALQTKKERLWIVGVPTKAGVSIFMLSIPDLRKELWDKAEDTIDTIKIL